MLGSYLKILEQERVPSAQRARELHEIARAHKSGDLLKRQMQRLQVHAVEFIREGKLDRALEELYEGGNLLTSLLDETPADVNLTVSLGYFYKTVAQAFEEGKDREHANYYLDLAERVFQLVKEDIPADTKSVADIAGAVNGLGNIRYMRGDLEKALEDHKFATTLVPTYAYAWHDLFGVYIALAKRGHVDLTAMRHALQKVKEMRAGYPALGADYIAQLEAMLRHWEQSA